MNSAVVGGGSRDVTRFFSVVFVSRDVTCLFSVVFVFINSDNIDKVSHPYKTKGKIIFFCVS
jgi:hypothetical protein